MAEEKRIPHIQKYRGVAAFLAVTLSICTWLYTYKFDKWKFCLGLTLNLLAFPLILAGIMGLEGLDSLGLLIIGVTHLWAIIDVLIKPSEFYDEYYYIE